MRTIIILLSASLLASCGSGASAPDGNQIAAAKPKEKPRYCFFKQDGTRDWKAAVDKQGNVVVTGKAFRQDGRYKAVLGEPKVTGTSAEVWPSVAANDTGFSTADGWWEVSAIIPDSAGVDSVAVRCGKRTLAQLKVPRNG